MANRRMFARSVTETGRFMSLSVSAQCLYFHLGMQADDDGFVEAVMSVRMAGLSDEDLQELYEKGYAVPINDSGLTWIADWNENNQLLKDRYRPSVYHGLLDQLKAGLVTERYQNDTTETPCKQNGNILVPQVSIGKESIVYNHAARDTRTRARTHAQGNDGSGGEDGEAFVAPTVEDVRRYCKEAGITLDAERFVTHYESMRWTINGKTLPHWDWKARARKWAKEDAERAAQQPQPVTSFDTDDFFAAALERSYGEPVPIPKRGNG